MALLEIQVVVIQDEVSDLETDVDFLFEEQVIQDEKLLNLEQETEVIEQNIVSKFNTSFNNLYTSLMPKFSFLFSSIRISTILFLIPDLQANTLDLEVRVGNLEENSGDDGNSSIAELELRVDTLEDVTAELELRVDTLEDVTAGQETRIVAAEENIQGEKQKLNKMSRYLNAVFHNQITKFSVASRSY